ncbi:MAG: hypothetical protein AAGF07_03295 [Patescibacteria group bacterium]
MMTNYNLKKIILLIILPVVFIVITVLALVGRNGGQNNQQEQANSQTNMTENENSSSDLIEDVNNLETEPDSFAEIQIRDEIQQQPDTVKDLTSGNQILIVNSALTAEQEAAIRAYSPIGDVDYDSFPELAKTSNTVFLKRNEQLIYLGGDIEYVSEFNYQNNFYWFYAVKSLDGSDSLYISEPDFKNIQAIQTVEPSFINKIETQENGIYKIYQNLGNTNSLEQNIVSINLFKFLEDPNSDIVDSV